MTVKELIKQLRKCSPDAEVILQKDSEGNGYSPLRGVDNEHIYVSHNLWTGDVYEECDLEDDSKMPKCCLLYPSN